MPSPIAEFFERFSLLRWYCGNDPIAIADIARSQEGEQFLLCLAALRSDVRQNEDEKSIYIRRSPISFRRALEEYDRYYCDIIEDVLRPGARAGMTQWILERLAAPKPDTASSSAPTRFHPDASEAARRVERVFEHLADKAADPLSEDSDKWQADCDAFEWFREAGLDLARFEERAHECALIFMPKPVHDAHSHRHSFSLIRLLEDVRRSYLAGANLAAIVLLRTALELILDQHVMPGFQRNPNDPRGRLAQMLDAFDRSYTASLPDLVTALRDLHKAANAVVHAGAVELRTEQSECLRFMGALKQLIEALPLHAKP